MSILDCCFWHCFAVLVLKEKWFNNGWYYKMSLLYETQHHKSKHHIYREFELYSCDRLKNKNFLSTFYYEGHSLGPSCDMDWISLFMCVRDRQSRLLWKHRFNSHFQIITFCSWYNCGQVKYPIVAALIIRINILHLSLY